MKRLLIGTVILIALGGLLAFLSYRTTGRHWSGGFPTGVFQLDVRDSDGTPIKGSDGTPIKGAVLSVFQADTQELAFGYPIDNHVTDNQLVSDETGRITAYRKYGGIQFGGHEWRLFWVIPIGVTRGPRYECEITAQGFQSVRYPLGKLFRPANGDIHKLPKTKMKVKGREIELRIYEQVFTLERTGQPK